MVHIKIKKGLDIPIEGAPSGPIREAPASSLAALDLTPFGSIHFRLLVQVGDVVAAGQPLVEDKQCLERVWVSCASGAVQEILRGEKRALDAIVIRKDGKDVHFPLPSVGEVIPYLAKTGLLPFLKMRPFNLPADPRLPPSIFVKAVESAPFVPSAEMQIEGKEDAFKAGLDFLARLAPVHLVCRKGTSCKSFLSAQNVHTVEGPHPVSNVSLHIQRIDPIRKASDVIWTIDAWAVAVIGSALLTGRIDVRRIVALAGAGVLPEHRGYYHSEMGASLDALTEGKLSKEPLRRLSGDPLMGEISPFLGFFHSTCTALMESNKRQPLHFLRAGWDKYTASRAYLSAFFPFKKQIAFNTLLHGEERAFVDPNVYDRVMPLKIPTALLVKAVIAGDFERAEEFGLLEVAPEDFALPTFVCPSKIEMVEIIENGLQRFSAESLSLR
jgi:Na+-transporting NADH:ubiquinone oxidoreductase subunit A